MKADSTQDQDEIAYSRPLKGCILLCAATRWETFPVVQRLGLTPIMDNLFLGAVKHHPLLLLKTGLGADNTAKALRGFDSTQAFRLLACVISTGFCGALQLGMNSGDILADLQGIDLELAEAARESAAAQKIPIHFGQIAHCDRVLSVPEQKAELGRSQRAGAVDMETSAIRAWAAERGLHALGLRVVLDGLYDSLPGSLPEGEDFPALTRFAFNNLSELPALIALGGKQRKAMANLSHFLELFLAKI